MVIILREYLPKILIALPFGIGFIAFFTLSLKRSDRFPPLGYQYDSKDRFKEIFFFSVYLSLGITCLIILTFLFQTEPFEVGIIPVALIMGMCTIPIGILVTYWRLYQAGAFDSGLRLDVRRSYIDTHPKLNEYPRSNEEKIELPHQTKFIAAFAAVLASVCIYLILSKVIWNGSIWIGIIFRWVVSDLLGLGVFMLTTSALQSHRIHKLRDKKNSRNDL
jgi:hypothetical protein